MFPRVAEGTAMSGSLVVGLESQLNVIYLYKKLRLSDIYILRLALIQCSNTGNFGLGGLAWETVFDFYFHSLYQNKKAVSVEKESHRSVKLVGKRTLNVVE